MDQVEILQVGYVAGDPDVRKADAERGVADNKCRDIDRNDDGIKAARKAMDDARKAAQKLEAEHAEAVEQAGRAAASDAIAGMKRCISEYSGTCLITSARNAFSEQPLSLIGTPVTLPISQFAIRDGILRVTSLS